MSANPRQFADKLRALSEQYANELPEKFSRLEQLWADFTSSGNVAPLREFIQQCHVLAGSGSTFGFPDITCAARELEQLLRPLLEENTLPGEKEIRQAGDLLRTLTRAGAHSPPPVADEAPAPTPPAREVRVYLFGDDSPLHHELGTQLGQFQYHVTRFTDTTALHDAVARQAPAIVVLDRDAPAAGNLAILMDDINEASLGETCVIVLSGEDTLALRLEAARANACAWVTKPVNIACMVDTIDRLATPTHREPYRVMVVDDDPDTRNFICFTLEQRGMHVFPVSRLDDILDNMRDFSPELVLTDLYMPKCTGLELARVIRQHEEFLGIPIVYLSAETDIHKQVMALSEGADDFLTKPIAPHKLIARIANRIQRYRGLSALLAHDGLTGLLNHTTFKERLQGEAVRADRQDSFFSYIMLDIDHFKTVNDTHGHATGDRVIKNLARLLSRRLRRSDIIGRYGGEEFAIILPDTAIEDAVRLLDRVREDFAQLRHRDDTGSEFQVTFSAGIAQYPDFADMQKVHTAADRALYAAKEAGRNRVVVRHSGDDD
ncbi:MAG TPA: diguanylate cyclase [Gammaproteobacteria bacterium]|nr:diguanylate cyclase [Gammaproteobacteria bacterium]